MYRWIVNRWIVYRELAQPKKIRFYKEVLDPGTLPHLGWSFSGYS